MSKRERAGWVNPHSHTYTLTSPDNTGLKPEPMLSDPGTWRISSVSHEMSRPGRHCENHHHAGRAGTKRPAVYGRGVQEGWDKRAVS